MRGHTTPHRNIIDYTLILKIYLHTQDTNSMCTVALLFLADLAGFIEITLFRARLEAVGALSLLSRVGTTLES